ncbi:MAG: zinc-ribbon domain-containing protein [Bradymonadaceae bacterium]|nr:zinc-ribbon domain-containing protein [Lujinxingiaceae bacterium]
MIVQCPSCASRYRVNDANIPPSGGKIRCPSCEHAFVVYPESAPMEIEDESDKTSVAAQPNLREILSHMQSRGNAQAPAAQEEEGVAMTEVMSGTDIPDFNSMFSRPSAAAQPEGGEDRTVEMANPLSLINDLFRANAPAAVIEDDMNTAELTPDVVRKSIEKAAAARAQSAAASSAAAPPPMPPMQPGGPPKRPTMPPMPAMQPPAPVILESPRAVTLPAEANSRPFAPSSSAPLPAPAMMPSQSFGEEPVLVAEPAPNPDHVGPWKLRTNFGLTYEFPDTKGLKSWLSNREELDGYALSGDGDNFFELDRFPQLRASASSLRRSGNFAAQQPASAGNMTPNMPGNMPGGLAANPGIRSTGNFGAAAPPSLSSSSPFSTANGLRNDVPASLPVNAGPKIKAESYRPPSREAKWNVVLWPLFALLLIIAGGLFVQAVGLYDVQGALLGTPEPALVPEIKPITEIAPVLDGAEQAEAAAQRKARQREQVDRIVADASLDMESNRLQTAAEKLTTAKALDPSRIQIYEMLGEVYTKLGQTEQASQARETLANLRETGAGSENQ